MAVSYRTGIIILQFICFVPAFFLSVWLCFRQGWRIAASSWRFVITLSLLRIISDIAYFISLSDPTVSTLATVIVCDLIGLAPLTLTCFGLLARVNTITHTFHIRCFTFVDLFALAGLIIGIVGAVLVVDALDPLDTAALSQAEDVFYTAVSIFLACFALLLVALLAIASSARHIDLGRERYILLAVAFSTPFLLVRLIYAAISDFSNDQDFALIDGNDTVYLVMSVLMEIFVTAICLTVGLFVPPPPKATAN